jgi:hypothetical protein
MQKRSGFKHAVHRGEGGRDPIAVIVVGVAPAVARAVVDEVGRVGDDEVNAGFGQCGQDSAAVAVQDAVAKQVKRGYGFYSLKG